MTPSSSTPDTTAVHRLRMQGVRKRSGATIALDGIDLAVDSGEILALVGEGTTAQTPTSKIIAMMIGRSVDDLCPRSPHRAGELVMEIKNLAGQFKPIDASLSLHRGEVLGVAGLVGAGRTELLRSIFGLDRIKSGHVRVGAYVGPASPARRWAQGMGLLSEDRKNEGLAVDLSLADNVTLTQMNWLMNPSRQAPRLL
jgi:ribose transport system ATP-binding protein